MRILLIDNFDSFTFNLVHYLEMFDVEVDVYLNTEVLGIDLTLYSGIVISPGPGLPNEAGDLMKVLMVVHNLQIPLLGVCLGCQAIAQYFGDELYNQKKVKHGVAEKISLIKPKSKLFRGIPIEFNVGLYHSWAIQLKENSVLQQTAASQNKVLMALEHPEYPIYGVQFHPESILTENGVEVVANFIQLCKKV